MPVYLIYAELECKRENSTKKLRFWLIVTDGVSKGFVTLASGLRNASRFNCRLEKISTQPAKKQAVQHDHFSLKSVLWR